MEGKKLEFETPSMQVIEMNPIVSIYDCLVL